MRIELEQKIKINELEEQIEELSKEVEYWKEKARDVYGEYLLLCDKIVSQGIYFDRNRQNEDKS